MLNWIRAFLDGRIMRVGINGSFSSWTAILSGVPQGSVLGPLLFLLFINDLSQWIKTNICMFADDTKIWTRISHMNDSESFQLFNKTLTLSAAGQTAGCYASVWTNAKLCTSNMKSTQVIALNRMARSGHYKKFPKKKM